MTAYAPTRRPDPRIVLPFRPIAETMLFSAGDLAASIHRRWRGKRKFKTTSDLVWLRWIRRFSAASRRRHFETISRMEAATPIPFLGALPSEADERPTGPLLRFPVSLAPPLSARGPGAFELQQRAEAAPTSSQQASSSGAERPDRGAIVVARRSTDPGQHDAALETPAPVPIIEALPSTTTGESGLELLQTPSIMGRPLLARDPAIFEARDQGLVHYAKPAKAISYNISHPTSESPAIVAVRKPAGLGSSDVTSDDLPEGGKPGLETAHLNPAGTTAESSHPQDLITQQVALKSTGILHTSLPGSPAPSQATAVQYAYASAAPARSDLLAGLAWRSHRILALTSESATDPVSAATRAFGKRVPIESHRALISNLATSTRRDARSPVASGTFSPLLKAASSRMFLTLAASLPDAPVSFVSRTVLPPQRASFLHSGSGTVMAGEGAPQALRSPAGRRALHKRIDVTGFDVPIGTSLPMYLSSAARNPLVVRQDAPVRDSISPEIGHIAESVSGTLLRQPARVSDVAGHVSAVSSSPPDTLDRHTSAEDSPIKVVSRMVTPVWSSTHESDPLLDTLPTNPPTMGAPDHELRMVRIRARTGSNASTTEYAANRFPPERLGLSHIRTRQGVESAGAIVRRATNLAITHGEQSSAASVHRSTRALREGIQRTQNSGLVACSGPSHDNAAGLNSYPLRADLASKITRESGDANTATLIQRSGTQPSSGGSPSGATASVPKTGVAESKPAPSQGNPDELVEKVMNLFMEQLAVESERRGLTAWN